MCRPFTENLSLKLMNTELFSFLFFTKLLDNAKDNVQILVVSWRGVVITFEAAGTENESGV